MDLRPGLPPGLQGHYSSACLTSSLHEDQHHSCPRQTLFVSGTPLFFLVCVRSQTWDLQLICLITDQSGLWPPGSPSTPWFLPVTGSSWLTYPTPYPELSSPRARSPIPQLLWPLYNSAILAAPLSQPVSQPSPPILVGSSSLALPPLFPHLAQIIVMFTLSPCRCLWLGFPSCLQ